MALPHSPIDRIDATTQKRFQHPWAACVSDLNDAWPEARAAPAVQPSGQPATPLIRPWPGPPFSRLANLANETVAY